MNLPGLLHNLAIIHLILHYEVVVAFTPGSRWGQATALVYDSLYVQGGMTDPSNAFSYTSAPITNDLLYLSLSSSFQVSSPPWVDVTTGYGANSSTQQQGPAVAWHTISPFSISKLLLFGGLPGPDSSAVLPLRADSAWLLDLPFSWKQEPTMWVSEPLRRIRHTAVVSTSGLVFIIGGERADFSKLTFSDHYVFDFSGPSFTQLPSTNGPSGITGHASVILSDGTLLVFGGVDANGALISFETIWRLDTTTNPYTWSSITVAAGSLPNSRRAFAAVLIEGGKVIIHGGCDADFLVTYSDGWVLDMSQNPPTWTQVSSLGQLGQRRDHFAVSSGDQVIFGFGYGANGPAPPDIVVWKPSDGSFPPTYNPPSLTSLSTTLPPSTQTSNPNGPNSGRPTSTIGVGGPGNPGESGNPNGPFDNGSGQNNKKATAIAVGTALGILGLLAGVVIVVYVVRRRQGRGEQRFMMLKEEDPENPHTAEGAVVARPIGEKARSSEGWTGFKTLGFGGALTAAPGGVVGIASTRRTAERRDMLADEDTRDFGWSDGWRRRNNSSWSLMSFMKRTKSREPSTGSYGNLSTGGSPWREKDDPFSDGAALMHDEETGFIGAAAPGHGGSTKRPFNRRDMSYTSTTSTLSRRSYVDPFADPIQEQRRDYYDLEDPAPRRPYPHPSQPLHVQTVLPSLTEVHTLSPVTEVSRGTLSQSDTTGSQSSHATSNEHYLSSGNDSHTTSQTSYSPRPSSLIDSMSASQSPGIRRSDTWWSRFSRTAFLDRRASASRRSGAGPLYDIRDPNPPPRLVTITESQNSGSHSGSPEHDKESPGSHRSNSIKRALTKKGSKLYGAGHGKSMSSIRTADSEALERMAGMDVVQRERNTGSGSQRTRESTGSSYDFAAEDERQLPNVVHGVDLSFSISSPAEMTSKEAASIRESTPPPASPKAHSPTAIPLPSSQPSSEASSNVSVAPPPSGSNVSARVQAYERRLSMSPEAVSPTSPKHNEDRPRRIPHVGYSLVPRASLYVANPDHKNSPSGDSV